MRTPAAPVGAQHPLKHAYQQATTVAWLGTVARASLSEDIKKG
jgi:hypothetical protein